LAREERQKSPGIFVNPTGPPPFATVRAEKLGRGMNSQAIGNRENSIKYLAFYVFKVAISE
jgi:hypothetical protein